MTINNKEWLTISDLKEIYGFSKSSQNQYRMAKKIPFHKVSRFIRYKRSEIDKWLQDNKVEVSS